MVNKTLKNIDFLLKNKERINDSELAYLFDLTVKYPFSSFCHYVVFSVLKKQNRTGYENMLKKTAIRFHNRVYLEQLANNLDLNIGKETAKALINKGANVLITGRSLERLNNSFKQLIQNHFFKVDDLFPSSQLKYLYQLYSQYLIGYMVYFL